MTNIAHFCSNDNSIKVGTIEECGCKRSIGWMNQENYSLELLLKIVNDYLDAEEEREKRILESSVPKYCLFCDKKMFPEFADKGWRCIQPSEGGEIQFHFSYGSRHDGSSYKTVVCDDCVEKYLEKMEKQRTF